MKNKFAKGATLLCSLLLLISGTSNAQKKLISFWDFNQTRPLGGAGGDSLGTTYSYANPYMVYAGSQDSIEATMPLFPNFTTNGATSAKILTIGHPNAGTKSFIDNGSGGAAYYDYSSNKYHYYNYSDSVDGNIYVRARNPVKNDTVFMYLPTTGYQNIQLNYAISASSTKGANYNIFSYSTNGGSSWKNLTTAMDTFNISGTYRPDTLQMLNPTTDASNWYPINMNFTSDASVNNNANVVLRWVYAGTNVTQTSGNNRYDNFALRGDSLCPTVSLQPINVTLCGGGNADFYIHTIGGTSVTYQWQIDSGFGFHNVVNAGVYSGATIDSLVITGATLAMNKYQYQCVVSNISCGTVTSTVATLRVDSILNDSISSFTNVTCLSNGTATVGVKGGISPYTYLWSNPSHQTTAAASNLTAGTYTVTVSDSIGCSNSAVATIGQLGLDLTIVSTTNAECTDGTALANASNGNAPYTYNWSDGETNANATMLTAGSYTLTATDMTGCSASTTVNIIQFAPLRDSLTGFGLYEIIHYWDFNNTAPVGGGGGDSLGNATNPLVAPYTQLPLTPGHIIYSRPHGDSILDNGTQGAAINNLNNIPAINAVLGNDTASQAAGNLYVRSRNKDTNATMYLYLPTTGYTNIQLNYAISASSTKGAFYNIFSYSTNGGISWSNLTSAMDTFNTSGIYHPDTLQMINSVTSVSQWYPVNINFASDTSVNNNANFVVRWKFAGRGSNGTSGNDRYDNISLSGNIKSEPCSGDNNFTAIAGVKYGQAPYSYSWSPNVSSSATASNLSAGTYVVTISDLNGCSSTSSITITQPTALITTITSVNNVKCNGSSDGGVTVNAVGGTSPYAYTWTNGGKKDSITGVSAGSYSVTVTDNFGCSATASVIITEPTALSISATTTADENCNGDKTGSTTSSVSGATSPYTYAWSNAGGSNSTASGLSAGTYTLTITDKNGCTGTASTTITQPTAIGATTYSVADNGSNNGVAAVTTNGGSSPYTYLWTPGSETTDTIKGQSAGTYTVTITDNSGCTYSTSVVILNSTGVANVSNGAVLNIYPDPNAGYFTISGVNRGQIIEVYDYTGQQLSSVVVSDNTTLHFDISNKANGIYLIRIINKDGSVASENKIVKMQ